MTTEGLQPQDTNSFEQREMLIHANGDEIIDPTLANEEGIPLAVQNLIAGMRARKNAQPKTLSEEMDELRHERVAAERADYLASLEAAPHTESESEDAIPVYQPNPIQGQLDLGGIVLPERPEGKRVAFGRYLKYWQYDMFNDHNKSIVQPEEVAWMVPERISSILFATRGKGEPYPDGLYVDGVLLNQFEYGLIPRSPDALGKASISKTLGDNDVTSEVVERAQRSRLHTFESRLEALDTHGAKLKERRELIIKLQRAAHKPGYAVGTPEEVKPMFAGAWSEFTNILDVLHIQRNWDQEKRQVAETALLMYLTEGKQSDRVQHWSQMLELSRTYLAARSHLIDVRTKELKELLKVRNVS